MNSIITPNTFTSVNVNSCFTVVSKPKIPVVSGFLYDEVTGEFLYDEITGATLTW